MMQFYMVIAINISYDIIARNRMTAVCKDILTDVILIDIDWFLAVKVL